MQWTFVVDLEFLGRNSSVFGGSRFGVFWV